MHFRVPRGELGTFSLRPLLLQMMPMQRKLAALFVLALLALPAQASAKDNAKPDKELSKKIDAILAQPELEHSLWGIDVVSVADHRTLYSLNEEKLFVPASNAKLFTTAAALALIGPDYRFHTTVETSGQLDSRGRILGDLTLVGRGDPNLSGRDLPFAIKTQRSRPALWVLDDLADQVAKRGVKFVEGDIIGDDSFYPADRFGEGWSQDDLQWYYGAPISALSLNDNVITVNVLPGDHQDQKAFIAVDPFTNYYTIENRLTTSAAGSARNVAIHRELGSHQIEFWGSIPLGDSGDQEELAIDDPAEFAAQEFRAALERHAVMIYGNARAHHTDVSAIPPVALPSALTTPASATPQNSTPATINPSPPAPLAQPSQILATHDSLPLIEDLRVINKVSHNLHAELALRLLGHQRAGAGTTAAGLQAVQTFAAQAGITPQEFVLYDGSGLSRQDLVAPAAFVKLLQFAAAQPWGAQFASTLPLAGVDGSLMDRFKASPAEGRVQAKTGSMDHVNTLSGYASTVSGDRLAFSIMVNNHELGHPSQTINEIVEAIVQSGGKRHGGHK